MRSICLACCLLAVIPPWAVAQDAAATPFWLLPKVELDLRGLVPANVKLVAAPDLWRNKFALLQVGNDDPRKDVSRVTGAETSCRVIAGGLRIGALTYFDRSYSITRLPEEFTGLTLLQTALQHTPVLDGRFAIVLATAKPCFVFVAVDEKALKTYKQHVIPSWLQEYTPTGRQIVTDRGNFPVFVRQALPGRIALGPPCMNASANAMYFAFFAVAK
jgi:hypothetical protein